MLKIYIKENISSKEILSYALKDYANIDNYELIYNEYGKPSLKDYSDIHFNISHKDNIIVLVIGSREVGIDIEDIKYNELVIKKAFNDKEIDIIDKSLDKAKEFTIMWTIKEAYIKYLGIGLSYGLKKVDSISLRNKVIIEEYKNYIITII